MPNQATHDLAGDHDLAYIQHQAVAADLFALFRTFAATLGGELEETSELCRHMTWPPNPMFKGAWQPHLTPETADDAIVETIAWFQARKAPFFFWWLDPSAAPQDLAERLIAHGLVPWDTHAPGMAAPLADLRYELLAQVPPGFEITRVQTEIDLLDFKQAFVAGLEVPEWAGQAWVDATLAVGIEHTPWRCYVGRIHGTPVASNMLFKGAGVASVFGVGTHPDFRRQGIGAAITLLPLQDARDQGYQYGVLFGTELGVPVYRRLGFHDVPSTISRYLWRVA